MALQPRVRRGQSLRIEAPTFNAMLDAAAFVQRQSHKFRGGASQATIEPGIVFVKNVGGDALDRFEAIGLEDVAIDILVSTDEFLEHPVFTGSLPTAQSEGRFAVLQEPVAPGAIARAVLCGVTPCKVVLADETTEFCDAASGSPYLWESPAGSAQILWSQGVAAAEQICVVRLWGKQYGKAFVARAPAGGISALSGTAPGSAIVTLYRLSGGSLVTTSRTLTVYNMAGAVASNAYIQVKQDTFGVWWVDTENCAT